MEKKGDIFNQLAMISDLLEKVNLNSNTQTIVFEVSEEEFKRIYELVTKKTRLTGGMPEETFNLKIGEVNIIFNKNNA